MDRSFPTLLCMLGLAAFALGCNRGPEAPEGARAQTETSMTESAMTEATASGSAMTESATGMAPHAGGAGMGMPVAPTIDPAAPALAGMRWRAPETFVYQRPQRPMRNAEYTVAGEAGPALMTVFHFPRMGGEIQDNVQRWVGQFRNTDGTPAEADVSRREVGGLEVHLVDVAGTYAPGMMGGGGPQSGQRLLGAIVVAPEGPVFFKLVGPDATVAGARDAFEAFVSSFEA